MSLEFLALFALLLSYPAILLALWLKRRTTLREFAARHGLRRRGILPSDKYSPYTRFDDVRGAVLLYNVMEGRWDDFDIALFDFPRKTGTCTGVILSVPNDATRFNIVPSSLVPIRAAVGERAGNWTRVALAGVLPSDIVVLEAVPGSAAEGIGPRTAALVRSGPPVVLQTNVGSLFVSPWRLVGPDDLPAFLACASSLARAVDDDAAKRN